MVQWGMREALHGGKGMGMGQDLRQANKLAAVPFVENSKIMPNFI